MKCELIDDFGITDYLGFYDKGYGVVEKGKVYLNLYEVLYLVEKEKLECYLKNKLLSIDELLDYGRKKEKNFFIKYLVFKDLREKGYVIKSGLKYGGDFRVYEKGKFKQDHSKWIVHVLTEKESLKMKDFSSKNRVAHSTRKKVLIAIVDSENSISYYQTEWIRM
ncbi:MAG: tRNA-intron lyase [Candidatus Woesearchaeota archaeon]